MRHGPRGDPRHNGTALPPPPPQSYKPRWALVLLALVQNALFGGVLYGWASVDRTLLVASDEAGGAGLAPEQATHAFAVASASSMLATLVLGAVLDAHGPRACSVVSHAAIAAGFALFAFAAQWQHCAVAGASLMAFGGPGIQVSVVHISNLFPNRQFFVLSGLTGSMSLSFSVLSIFDFLWETYGVAGGMSVRRMFGGYAVLAVASLVASCLVWPDESFPPPPSKPILDPQHHQRAPTAEEEYVEAVTAHSHLVMEQPLQSYLRHNDGGEEEEEEEAEMSRLMRKPSYLESSAALSEGGDPHLVSLKDQPFVRQLSSPQYLWSVLAFLVACFLANFYVASFSTEVRGPHGRFILGLLCTPHHFRFTHPCVRRRRWPTCTTTRARSGTSSREG
jgi:Major Facilitator Superfamily